MTERIAFTSPYRHGYISALVICSQWVQKQNRNRCFFLFLVPQSKLRVEYGPNKLCIDSLKFFGVIIT